MLIFTALLDFLRDQRCRGNSPKTFDYYSTVIGYFIDYVGDPDVSLIDLRMLQDYRLSKPGIYWCSCGNSNPGPFD